MKDFTFRVGVGRRDITPPIGTYLAGYSPARPAESVHDPLHIIVTVFEQNGEKALMAAMDTCNTGNAEVELRQAMARAADVPFEHCNISATHTHSGPIVFVTPPYGHPNPEYVFGTLIPLAAEAAAEAASRLEWAEMGVNTVYSTVGINRRERREDGKVVLGQEPLNLFDPTMTVVSFRNAEKKCLLNMIHYGCHNTGSGKNSAITRDWAGVMKDRLEEQSGGVSAFFNGCEGDCGPRLANGKTTGDLEMALELGGKAAIDACTCWRGIREWRRDVKLKTLCGSIEIPYEELPPMELLKEQLEALGDPETLKGGEKALHKGLTRRIALLESGAELPPVQQIVTPLVALGPVCFVPSTFESFALMTMRISRHSPFPYTLVISQSNTKLFYLPTQDQIPLGGYEVNECYLSKERPYVKDADNYYVQGALKLLRELWEEK